jgi:hypothetical protein
LKRLEQPYPVPTPNWLPDYTRQRVEFPINSVAEMQRRDKLFRLPHKPA